MMPHLARVLILIIDCNLAILSMLIKINTYFGDPAWPHNRPVRDRPALGVRMSR
jgi:hypothetical protein